MGDLTARRARLRLTNAFTAARSDLPSPYPGSFINL